MITNIEEFIAWNEFYRDRLKFHQSHKVSLTIFRVMDIPDIATIEFIKHYKVFILEEENKEDSISSTPSWDINDKGLHTDHHKLMIFK